MRAEEAAWLGHELSRLDLRVVLELGSSTAEFRRKNPHIPEFIHDPLQARGVHVVRSDLKSAPGVDIIGDIYSAAVQEKVRAVAPDAILCCNMVEHVTDPVALSGVVDRMLRSGGYAVLSAPHSYPIHRDPIDTYFRPSPDQLAALFPGYRVVAHSVIKSSSYGADLLRMRQPLREAARCVWALLKVFSLPRGEYVALNHRLLWLFRRYKVSCAILQKP